MSDKLNKSNLKRTTSYNRLKECYDLGQAAGTDETKKAEFLARSEELDDIYDEFKTQHNIVIGLITDEEFKIYDVMRMSADKAYYGSKGIRNDFLIKESSAHNNTVSSQNPTPSKISVNLPKLIMPKFNGNYKNWPAFYDFFNSVFHNNPDVPDIDKYRHLLTLLEEEPLSLIKGLPITEANYQVAYNILENRYQNKRILATQYYNALFNAPSIKKATAIELRRLLNTFTENIAALRALQFQVDHWCFLLFNLFAGKLDEKTRTDFELENGLSRDIPTYRQLSLFVEKTCKALESVQYTTNYISANLTPQAKFINKDKSSHFSKNPTSAFLTNETSSNNSQQCVLCSGSHSLPKCQLFLHKTPQERFSIVKQNKLCVKCLISPHAIKNCSSRFNCRVCKFPHSTMLHFNKASHPASISDSNNVATNRNSDLERPPSITATHCNTPNITQSTVLLSTCQVDIRDVRGNYQKIRVLCDSGSMSNFISEKCVQKLGLSRKPYSIPVEGLNGMSTLANSGLAHCIIKPCDQNNPIFSFESIIVPKVCSDQPKIKFNPNLFSHICGLKLADDRFHVPGPVDMLIGCEIFPRILLSGRIMGNVNQPIALETIFGYILQGKVSQVESKVESTVNCHVSLENLDAQLGKFWEIEQVAKAPSCSAEEYKCEEIYKASTFREPSGRFSVPLPFKGPNPTFLDTYSQAYRRFSMLERRFLRNPTLWEKYKEFMKIYLDSNHMSIVPLSNYKSTTGYYICHHAIFKEQISGPPKIRVVFDASARDVLGTSLNDTLHVGPKLQKDIASILLAFRYYAVVFICDVVAMYRQINVHKEYWDYQRILWRFDPSEPLQEYFLRTVVYGISSSPYLALRTLQELADQEESSFPNAAKCLRSQFYIDDGIVGNHDIQSALSLQSELIQLMRKGGFELSKWASNHPELLKNFDESEIQQSCSFDKEEPSFIKVLGLKWDPGSDIFSYSYVPIERPCTKRNLLSEISRIYDPLGYVSPCLLLAKRLLQLLWQSRTDWDDTPPQNILDSWIKYKSEMPLLAEVKIPRYIGSNTVFNIQLHGFCDASLLGYSSCVYFRVMDMSGNIKTFLICAKCKVAPLQTQSIARLELMAAKLLSDLVYFVQKSYAGLIVFKEIYLWSDSMVTLHWLAAPPNKWKTFVANRVSHIQELVPATSWHYIPSSLNPADCASRGQSPAQLLDNTLWWSGPDFLLCDMSSWPTKPNLEPQFVSEIIQEEKKESTVLLVSDDLDNLVFSMLNRYSSLDKIKSLFSKVYRVVLNFKAGKTHKIVGPITPIERDTSFRVIIKIVQRSVFADIFLLMGKNKLLPKPIRKLAPFIDHEGLLRVGGRLKYSQLTYEVKHPILLPKSHRLTHLIIEWTHKEHLHPGLKTMQYLLLQQYWILSPRSAVYKCLANCIRCFRCKPKSYNPYMADLPSLRVSQLRAFTSVCVDFAGPFTLLLSRHKSGLRTYKGYVCVFVCTSVRAVHLEVTSDLSSDAFLGAFRRFIARRGQCVYITSDQGTNFKGANNQLLELAKQASEKLKICWRFNVPGSPHMNGLAEAGVKSFKSHFYKVLGNQILSYEEFCTLTTQIEAILNSRPLCAQSSDANDLVPLTPGHFLNLEPLNNPIPEIDLSHLSMNRLSRWQLVQRLQSDFWTRWSTEYVHSLQVRHKWTEPSPPIKLGDLVLIKHESKAPLHWELGRVSALHPGQDKVVRAVTLKTTHGLLQRPVVKICPLPGN